jgi:hypothetical protein
MVIVAVMYFLHHFAISTWKNNWVNFSLATILTGLFILFVLRIERKEFARMPVIGKYL